MQQIEAAETKRSTRALNVTGKVRTAIEAMVWLGLNRSDAAERAGFTDHALYCAMRKPHVKAFYLAECEQLRISGRARRIHRLNELSEQNDNLNAAVAAIKANEQLGELVLGGHNGAVNSSPGVVIVIQGAVTAHERAINAKPLIEQTSSQVQTHHGSMSNDSADGE